MKKSYIRNATSLSFIILTLFGCDSPTGIFGKIEGVKKAGVNIYLIQPQTLHDVAASYFGTVVDSAVVKSDGSFTFNNLPKTSEPVLFELAIPPTGKLANYLQNDDLSTSNYMPIEWHTGESLKITTKLDEFQKSFSIENPSPINEALLAVRDVNQKAYQTYLKGKQWEVEDGEQLMAKQDAILNYQSELIDFANNTKYLLPALVALRWVSPANYYERVPEFLVNQCDKWSEKQSDHPWVKELCNQSQAANLPVLMGAEFPNIDLPMMTNDTFSLYSQLGNKLTIIDLWASWCAPCRMENRKVLVPLWDMYHNQGLQIIGYSLEGNASGWKAAVEKDGADRWLQSSELKGDDAPFLKKIRVQTIPANFILNSQGVVVAKNLHGKELRIWVKNYLKNNSNQ